MRNQMFQMRSQTSYCFLDLNSITTSPFAPTHGCVSGVFWAKISLSIARNVFEDPRKTEWPCAQTPDPIAGRFHGCFAVCECKLQWTHTSTHIHTIWNRRVLWWPRWDGRACGLFSSRNSSPCHPCPATNTRTKQQTEKYQDEVSL